MRTAAVRYKEGLGLIRWSVERGVYARHDLRVEVISKGRLMGGGRDGPVRASAMRTRRDCIVSIL